ncbi:MAG: hypothetical protein WKF94_02315 [Solirubrobacteraceae bacterium]
MRRFASADPAAGHDPDCNEELLARIVDDKRSPARPRAARSPLRFVPLVAAAAVALAGGLAALLTNDERVEPVRELGDLALASRAYAQTNPRPGKILHTVVTFVSTREFVETGEVTVETIGRVEQWHRGTESHTLNRYGGPGTAGRGQALDHVVANGVMRQVSADGSYRIVRASDNGDSARVIREEQRGFIEEFRRRYEQGDLDPDGDVTFAGRPARRYLHTQIVKGRDTEGKLLFENPGPTTAYYIDRETGDPLGSRLVDDGPGDTMLPGGRVIESESEQIVRLIEWLPPTRENLDDLREFLLPRRRDAQGCIRGASRKRAEAPKLECGGTPGAPIRAK